MEVPAGNGKVERHHGRRQVRPGDEREAHRGRHWAGVCQGERYVRAFQVVLRITAWWSGPAEPGRPLTMTVSQQEATITDKGAEQRRSKRTGARAVTSRRMGALPSRYLFALNPYTEVRFTTCPRCEAKTRVRKLPLAIHTEGVGLFVLRKTCRLCVACGIVIVHQDELEPLIAARTRHREASSKPLDYLVLGTVDPRVWRQGLARGVSLDELLRHMADFSRYMQIEQTGRGWEPAK